MRKFEEKFLRLDNFNSSMLVSPEIIRGCISHLYTTLDIIDENLSDNGSDKFSLLVEKANLSSVVGNILGSGVVKYSNNRYYRNEPNTFRICYRQIVEIGELRLKLLLEEMLPKAIT